MLVSDFDLRHFSEDSIEGESVVTTGEGGNISSTETSDVGKKKTFDQLIQSEYRDDYSRKVEAIVKGRLKNHAETKERLGRLAEKVGRLGKSLGVEGDDPESILEGLHAKIGKSDFQNNKEIDSITGEQIPEKVHAMAVRCMETKEVYPDFDITKELGDPEYQKYLKAIGDPKTAFEMKYHDKILVNAMRYAVQKTEERLAGSLASKVNRPTEAALTDNSAAMISKDPKSLTKADRARIKKRVRRGERIVW